MKSKDIKHIVEDVLAQEVKKAILENESQDLVYIIKHKKDNDESEPVEICQTEEEAKNKLEVYTADHPNKEFIIEKGPKPSIDELDQMGEELEEKENTNMENTQPMEGNEFSGALKAAKDAGKSTFTVNGKEYNVEECWAKQMNEKLVGNQSKLDKNHNGKLDKQDFKMLQANEEECDECWAKDMDENQSVVMKGIDENDEDPFSGWENIPTQTNEEAQMCNECGMPLNEEGMCNECGNQMVSINENKKKKVLRLTETEMKALIKKLVSEANIPGVTAVEKHKKTSGAEANKEIGDMMKDIEKNHQKVKGSDNPKFPNQVGQGEEKAARVNSTEEDEYVDDFRGGTLLDLNYDSEPSKQFHDRVGKSLEGHASTGNSQDYANVVKSDLGKKMAKTAKRKIENKEKMPMYQKDPVVTTTAKKKEVHMAESVDSSKKVILEEIQRMKNMASYNEKTQ